MEILWLASLEFSVQIRYVKRIDDAGQAQIFTKYKLCHAFRFMKHFVLILKLDLWLQY